MIFISQVVDLGYATGVKILRHCQMYDQAWQIYVPTQVYCTLLEISFINHSSLYLCKIRWLVLIRTKPLMEYIRIVRIVNQCKLLNILIELLQVFTFLEFPLSPSQTSFPYLVSYIANITKSVNQSSKIH